jgi:hypothetical protein
LDQSHRQARRFLEAGGAVSSKARAGDGAEINAFIVPPDIDRAALGRRSRVSSGMVGVHDRVRTAVRWRRSVLMPAAGRS